MKKQFLIMMFLSLAFMFAGMNNSYGQTYTNYLEPATTGNIACTPAIPLNCIEDADALHPLPGEVYTYSISTNPATVASVHWFVTDVSNVIAVQNTLTGDIDLVDGDYVLTATTASYNVPGNTAQTIDISWKSFDGISNQVLLVAYVSGADGCSDNIEVYRIEPEFGFTLDVAGLLDDGTLGAEECVSPVESAIYNGSELEMNYGQNWVFFSVNAANFVDSWMPDFSATVTGGSTIGTVQWAYPADAEANTTWNNSGVAVNASAASGGAVDSDGECIVIRVQVIHADVELSADDAPAVVTLSIDGVMYDPATDGYTNGDLADLDEPVTPGDPCRNDYTDTANYTLTPRPAISSTTDDVNDTGTAVEDFVTKVAP